MVLFIANVIVFSTRAAVEKFEDLWLVGILSLVSAVLFIILGSYEENP